MWGGWGVALESHSREPSPSSMCMHNTWDLVQPQILMLWVWVGPRLPS